MLGGYLLETLNFSSSWTYTLDMEVSIKGFSKKVNIDRIPDMCPLCHQGIQPLFTEVTNGSPKMYYAELVLQCPRDRCRRVFIARYLDQYGYGGYQLSECVPSNFRVIEFSKRIQDISPIFYEIYNQANAAEQMGLVQVCGPGYRKALEFLIKDYVCHGLDPADSQIQKIKDMFLAVCIENYVSDTNIKETAKRAVWLGNDETHYVRKWEDKDLQDLKKLISLTVHWIEAQKLTEDLLKSMPDPKAAAAKKP